jgi:hypothetical protein
MSCFSSPQLVGVLLQLRVSHSAIKPEKNNQERIHQMTSEKEYDNDCFCKSGQAHFKECIPLELVSGPSGHTPCQCQDVPVRDTTNMLEMHSTFTHRYGTTHKCKLRIDAP